MHARNPTYDGLAGEAPVVAKEVQQRERVIIRFAGDSGDGMQLTGDRFTSETAEFGNDISTLPDFPAEIRAPAGTLPAAPGLPRRDPSARRHPAGRLRVPAALCRPRRDDAR